MLVVIEPWGKLGYTEKCWEICIGVFIWALSRACKPSKPYCLSIYINRRVVRYVNVGHHYRTPRLFNTFAFIPPSPSPIISKCHLKSVTYTHKYFTSILTTLVVTLIVSKIKLTIKSVRNIYLTDITASTFIYFNQFGSTNRATVFIVFGFRICLTGQKLIQDQQL